MGLRRGAKIGWSMVGFMANPTDHRRSASAMWTLRIFGPIPLVGCALLVLSVASCKQSSPRQEPASAVDPVVDPPPPPAQPLIGEDYATLSDAIAGLKPLMQDTPNKHSKGTWLLAFWAADHLTLQDVNIRKNETTIALVQKDSDEERGKRMCFSGFIIQIESVKLDSGKVYAGLLMTWNRDIVSFIAAGSTGKLVERSNGRFCGVVTGKYQYSNSAGGTGHALDVVGMFDIKENRAAPAPDTDGSLEVVGQSGAPSTSKRPANADGNLTATRAHRQVEGAVGGPELPADAPRRRPQAGQSGTDDEETRCLTKGDCAGAVAQP